MTDEADPLATRPVTLAKHRAITRFRIAVVAGPATGASWSEPAERCTVGSHPSNDLIIDDPTVSRFHCELAITGDHVRVRDLGSRNGTAANKVRVVDGSIASGTTLVLGHSELAVALEGGVARIEMSDRDRFGPLVGVSEPMRELFSRLERIAPTDATVLIEGETGTGKEGVAEAIHRASSRSSAPFVVVDCGAVPGTLLESELFGHEPGAFTGATARRIGAFEEASGGTLFLDEIGELGLELQPKLLRALESREIRRVGGRASIKCDLRIVSATNRDLRAEVNRGTFRADLYYRLALVNVGLPPLRERRADVPILADHLLRRMGASEAVIEELTAPGFLRLLASAPWPGNVRELRNHLEQCVVYGEPYPPGIPTPPHPAAPDPTKRYELARRQSLDAFEHGYVTALLERTTGNVTQAAREAGLTRSYLHRLLRRHGLR